MSSSVTDLRFWEDLGKYAPVAVIASDLEGIVRVWSSGADSLFDRSSTEEIGQPIQEITVGPIERDKHSDVIELHVLDFAVRDVEGR